MNQIDKFYCDKIAFDELKGMFEVFLVRCDQIICLIAK